MQIEDIALQPFEWLKAPIVTFLHFTSFGPCALLIELQDHNKSCVDALALYRHNSHLLTVELRVTLFHQHEIKLLHNFIFILSYFFILKTFV